MRRLLLIIALLSPLAGITQAQGCAAPNWSASYFNSADLQGFPVATSCDPAINFQWGAAAPQTGVNADHFAVRWTSTQTFETPGNWQFTLTVEDGARLYVNGTPIMQASGEVDVPRTLTGSYTTTAENTTVFIVLEMTHLTGNAQISLLWAAQGQSSPVPGGGQPWTVQYFNTPDFSGGMVATERFPPDGISRNYGSNAPISGLNPDGWSARWTRVIDFPEGDYVFTARANDRVRVLIDNVQILRADNYEEGKSYTVTVFIDTGPHTIVVEHSDSGENADLFLTWEPPVGTVLLPGGCNGATAGINGSDLPCPDQVQAANLVVATPAPVSLPVTVSAGPLHFRAEPSQEAETLDLISEGEQYTASGRTGDNLWVQLAVEGQVGWSMAEFLTLEGDINQLGVVAGGTTIPVMPVTTALPTGVQAQALASVRLREGADISLTRIGEVRHGQMVTVIGRNGDGSWLKVEVNGVQGWALSQWFQIISGDVGSVGVE